MYLAELAPDGTGPVLCEPNGARRRIVTTSAACPRLAFIYDRHATHTRTVLDIRLACCHGYADSGRVVGPLGAHHGH